jgi:hypothetical protein
VRWCEVGNKLDVSGHRNNRKEVVEEEVEASTKREVVQAGVIFFIAVMKSARVTLMFSMSISNLSGLS